MAFKTSRRTALRAAGAASLCTMLRGSPSQKQEGGENSASPPSILALQSMRTLAKPITVEERRARIARAQALMNGAKIDAVLLAGGTSMLYFTGMRWGRVNGCLQP